MNFRNTNDEPQKYKLKFPVNVKEIRKGIYYLLSLVRLEIFRFTLVA